jgi:structural maintenance of chromosome 1
MDALAFVLGVRSAQLRSTQLKDLIYRGGVKGGEDDDEEIDANGEDGAQETEEGRAQKAWVRAHYIDEQGKEWRWMRT